MNAKELFAKLCEYAPIELSDKLVAVENGYDNSGIILDCDLDAKKVLFCLDLTHESVDYAIGKEDGPVLKDNESDEVKSVGNSITCYRDLTTLEDVKIVLTVLAESVSARVIKHGLGRAETLSISIRDTNLKTMSRQCKFEVPTNLPDDITLTAYELFKKNYDMSYPVRTLGISVCGFSGGVDRSRKNAW